VAVFRVSIITAIFLIGLTVSADAACLITVAADGSGDVKTVSAALAKVPEDNKSRCTIKIKSGTYDPYFQDL